MTRLLQITDTHILPPGELLYGKTDSAAHLARIVSEINSMQPQPDLVIVTGDLVEGEHDRSYRHFIDLVSTLAAPLRVVPGNHDDAQTMLGAFADTPYFPADAGFSQYVIEDLSFRIVAIDSTCAGSELPALDKRRLDWLDDQLGRSDKPVLIAMHHPPMVTGIEFIDMGGSTWFRELEILLDRHPQVALVICGHCHTDLIGRIGQVPVYMAPSTAHQLIAARGVDIAPATIIAPAPAVLHHYLDGRFLSGSYPWPGGVEASRIDQDSGHSWSDMKRRMMGSRA